MFYKLATYVVKIKDTECEEKSHSGSGHIMKALMKENVLVV